MKITAKTLVYEFEYWVKLVSEPPVYNVEFYKKIGNKQVNTNIFDVVFDDFCSALKYMQYQTMSEFLSELTGIDTTTIKQKPLYKILGLYDFFKSECEKVLKMFEEINDFAVKPKKSLVLYDMAEFGFDNIISAIAKGDLTKHREISKFGLGEVILLFRRATKERANETYYQNSLIKD